MDWKRVFPFYVVELDRLIRKLIEEHDTELPVWRVYEDLSDFTRETTEDIMDNSFYLMSILYPDNMNPYRDIYTSPRRIAYCAVHSYRGSYSHLTETFLFKIRNAVELDKNLQDFLYNFTLLRFESISANNATNQSLATEKDFGFELDDVPARNSPRHILNVLNDDCIAEIFRRLDSFVDYHNVTKVCRKFRNVAAICFPYKTFRIGEYEEDRHVPTYPPQPISDFNESLLNQLEEFLHDFGHQINSIEWATRMLPATTFQGAKAIFTAIGNFCGKTLRNLKIIGPVLIDCNPFPLSRFEVLQTLELYHVLFRFFTPLNLPKLKCLKLGNVLLKECGWLSQPFPELIEVHLLYNSICKTHETEFLRLNPQLKSLVLKHRSHDHLQPTDEKSLQNCPPNLASLYLNNVSVNLKTLSETKLNRLHIPSMNFTQAELNSLIATNLPIEELEITPTSVDFVEDMSKLRSLKKLSIRITKVSQCDAVNIIRKLPALEQLTVSSGKLSLPKVKEIIQHSSRIVGVLTLRLEWINIDSEEYFSILTLAKRRGLIVKLYVDRWTGRVDVRDDILQSNRMWLDIQSKFIVP